jgi:hypothetical protein
MTTQGPDAPMTEEELLAALKATETMPELDALRGETGRLMVSHGQDRFDMIQGAFRKAKNRIKRVPLRDRVGW